MDKKNKGGAKSKAKPKKGKKVVDDEEDEDGEDHETDDEEDDVKEDSEDPDKEDSEGLPDWINTDGEETEAPSEAPSLHGPWGR